MLHPWRLWFKTSFYPFASFKVWIRTKISHLPGVNFEVPYIVWGLCWWFSGRKVKVRVPYLMVCCSMRTCRGVQDCKAYWDSVEGWCRLEIARGSEALFSCLSWTVHAVVSPLMHAWLLPKVQQENTDYWPL